MSKGLQALKDLDKQVFAVNNTKKYNECLGIIEKELKALEIIKNKKVNVHLLLDECCPDLETYNCYGFEPLTQEEYDLLKEVLEND